MIIFGIEYSEKILSLTILKKNYIFSKEIFGNLVNSQYILTCIKNILIKNNINEKNISLILISTLSKNLTSIKINFSIIQSFALIYSIPLIQIKFQQSLVIKSFFIKKQLYFFYKKNLYLINKNLYRLIIKNKKFDNNLIKLIKKNINFNLFYTSLKAINLIIFLIYKKNFTMYMIPNSSYIKYFINKNEQHYNNK